MYDQHYGLTGRPFQLTPDPRFWFDTATHKKAMAYLGYGLSQGEGFIVVTGDIGAGKTTLVGHLVDTVDADRLNVIRIVSTQIAADDLLRTVCAGLDVDAAGLAKAQMLGAIERGLHAVARAGRRTLLIVDEAQALPIDSLEELRMLSNFQAGGYALLQIFLLGQPEFRDKLADAALEQLRQRVIAMHHLGPMEADELEPYLIHRLTVVGWDGRPRFKTDALATIYAWSGGIPRRINQLVSRVLLHGALEGIETFTAADVMAVVTDLDNDGMTGGATPDFAPDVAEPAYVVEHDVVVEDVVGSLPPMEWPFDDVAPAPEVEEVAEWRPIFTDEPAAEAPVEPQAPVGSEELVEPENAVDDDAEDDDIATQPVSISAPPRLFDRISLRGRKPMLAPVDPAPEEPVAELFTIDEPTAIEQPVAIEEPVAIEQPTPAIETVAPEPVADDPAQIIDLDIARRLIAIDQRLDDQDVALRRVLTLLVDWVESGGARPDLAGEGVAELRDAAG